MFKVFSFLIGVCSLTLVGCDRYEDVTPSTCQARAPTEYNAGISSATTDNKADYDRGYANGAALSYDDGKAAGLQAAYNNGYNSIYGYDKGYNEQYPIGYSAGKASSQAVVNGINDGNNDGATKGKNDGKRDGWEDGEYDGRQLGESEGAEDGYADGYNAGGWSAYDDPVGVCSGHGFGDDAPSGRKQKKLPANFAADCRTLGYSRTRDATGNYNKGYAAAKAVNTAYQQGYNDFKNDVASYNQGVAKGYVDGKYHGYQDGWADGYDYTYTIAYNTVYTTAYNNAYNYWYSIEYSAGFDYGYENAYEDAYDDMYSQGFVDGEYDYCYDYYGSSGGRKSGGAAKTYRKSSGFVTKKAQYGSFTLSVLKAHTKAKKPDEAKLKVKRTELRGTSWDRMLRQKIRETGDQKFIELMNDMEFEIHFPADVR